MKKQTHTKKMYKSILNSWVLHIVTFARLHNGSNSTAKSFINRFKTTCIIVCVHVLHAYACVCAREEESCVHVCPCGSTCIYTCEHAIRGYMSELLQAKDCSVSLQVVLADHLCHTMGKNIVCTYRCAWGKVDYIPVPTCLVSLLAEDNKTSNVKHMHAHI